MQATSQYETDNVQLNVFENGNCILYIKDIQELRIVLLNSKTNKITITYCGNNMYYIQGDSVYANNIAKAFDKVKGQNVHRYKFDDRNLLYYNSTNNQIECIDSRSAEADIIKYYGKELKIETKLSFNYKKIKGEDCHKAEKAVMDFLRKRVENIPFGNCCERADTIQMTRELFEIIKPYINIE